MPSPIKYKSIFLTFFECGVKGEWKDQPMWEMHYYTALDDQNELWIVRPDGLKRAFRFRESSTIKIAQNLVKFDVKDVIEEIVVDEDERQGKPSLNKLDIL